LSKLLHRSKFGKKAVGPQITQIQADTESRFEREISERTEPILCFFRALLFEKSSSASICVNLRAIPDSVAALPRWEIRGSICFGCSEPRYASCPFAMAPAHIASV
jgi:hypothetical protein